MSEPKPVTASKPTGAADAGGARGRRTRARVFLPANALLLSVIVAMLNYLAFRHYERWDWTEESLFTLSDRSERVLEGLGQPVEIWVLVSESEPEHRELRTLLERYRAASDRLTVRFADPHRDPGAYTDAVRRFRLREGERQTREGVVRTTDVALVVVAGERQWEVGREDLVSHSIVDEGGEERLQLNVEAERALTGAILQVTEGRPTKICFTTGHGEIALEEGLSELAAELRRENLGRESVATRGLSALPEGCDTLAIIGPERAFDEREAELIREYVRSGGNLLVALDPMPDPDRRRVVPTGLEGPLRDFGVRVGNDVVVEPNPARHPPGQGHPISLYLAGDFGEHRITAPFRESGFDLAVSNARSVRPIEEEGPASVLLSTSASSYAETDLSAFARGELGEASPGDLPGPVPIAVAAQVEVTGSDEGASERDEGASEREDGPGGRVVVLGSSAIFASDFLATQAVMNLPFAGASIGWLTEREAMISIPSRTVGQPAMPSEADVNNLFFRVVVLIPLAFVFLGIAVWWNRRL